MAGLTEDGGEGGKGEVWLAGEPVRREDQHDLHLPAAGGLGSLPLEQNQLFGGPFALRILNAHRDLVPFSPGCETTRIIQKAKGLGGYCKGEED